MKTHLNFIIYTLTFVFVLCVYSHPVICAASEEQAVLWKTPLRGVTVNIRINKEDLRNLKENWGANSVRLMLMNGDLRDADSPFAIQQEKLEAIDRFLDWCEDLQIRCVLDVHETPGRVEWRGEKDRRLWSEYRFHDLLNDTWAVLAKRYAKRGDVIAGYDLFNEPNMDKQIPDTPSDWNALAKRLTNTIRQYDKEHVIVVETIQWGSASGFEHLEPTGDARTIYSFHFYQPHAFTHQNVSDETEPIAYPGEVRGKHWDQNALEEAMKPAIDFQKKHNCQIYVGEFSAIRWAPGDSAFIYLRDVVSIFEKHGWSWAYHAYREWDGWSLEHEGARNDTQGPLESTPRLELFRKVWQKNSNQ